MAALVLGLGTAPSPAQELTGRDRDRADVMLRGTQNAILRHYYDTTFGGLDLREAFASARARLAAARSNSELFAIIAQAVFALDDSHTYFVPPARGADVRYGWGLAVVGDSCFVVAVHPASDASRQGVRVGDFVASVDGFRPSRRDFWKLAYVLNALSPRTEVTLVLISPGAAPRTVRVQSRVRERRRVLDLTGRDGGADLWELIRRSEDIELLWRDELVTVGDSTLIWRMPSFSVEQDAIDDAVGRARRHRNLVLDLRGNGGGYESALRRLIGRLVDRDVQVGVLQRRREPDTLRARPGGAPFTGRLVVLVDARSASAAELFARVVQLERRGSVLGDRTAGAVMRSRFYPLEAGDAMGTAFYGVAVTDADIIMADGRSLERIGVVPDEFLVPTGADLAAGRDPVLSRALRMLGHTVDPQRAGRLLTSRRRELDVW